MYFFFLLFHIIVTIVLLIVILLQRGEDISAGSGGSGNQLFSARSSKNLFTRITAVLAVLFFSGCILLAILVRKESKLVENKRVSVSENASVSSSDKHPAPSYQKKNG